METQSKTDIVIIGGGMAGASLALLLEKFLPDINITLIEAVDILNNDSRNTPPSYDDRCSALSIGSCRILEKLDIWNTLLPSLTPINTVHVSDRGHPAGTLIQNSEYDLDNLGYIVENRNLGQALLNSLKSSNNIVLQSPAHVNAVTPRKECACVEIERNGSTEELSAQLVVIAEGANSSLCNNLGIAFEDIPYEQSAVVANVSISTPHDNVAYERFTDTGPMALLPLTDFRDQHRAALVWTVPSSLHDKVSSMDDNTLIETLQERFGNRLGFFTHVGKRAIYPLSLHRAKEQIRHNIVLIGNTAHSMHPVAGQGFNLALRDCASLVDTLCDAENNGLDIGSLGVLEQYLERQQLDQEKTIGASHLLTLLFSTDSTPAAFARNTGLFGLNFLPGIKSIFAKHAMGTSGNKSQIAQPQANLP